MAYTATTSTRKILNMRKNIRLIAGGTSAGKTISILQVLIDIAQSSTLKDSGGLPIDVVSETMPHMRGGAMKDFENIMTEQGYWNPERWNKTFSTYTFETGIKMQFYSADTPSKAHGPRRWILYINEGNSIPWNVVDHMMVRTKYLIFVDWNPSVEYWAYTEIMQNKAYADQYDFLTLTYKDNEALDPISISRIEAHKDNAGWWKVYGEGQLGEIEGRIYTGWNWIDEIPYEAKHIKRGLDFGYTNHPTGILSLYQYNGGFIVDEECYQYGMSNEDIDTHVRSLADPMKLIIADSAEPKSITRLQTLGLNVMGAQKGQGSVNEGIDYIKSQKISATKSSIHLKKEYERYIWLKDRLTDKFTNNPPDMDNHLLDALRYALESFMPTEEDERTYTTGRASTLMY